MGQLPDIEHKVLALLIAQSPEASPFFDSVLGSTDQIDWARFDPLVERHRVGALVHLGLQQLPVVDPPSENSRRLALKMAENAEHFMSAVKLAHEITGHLEAKGIACAWLKGIGLAAKYYAAPSHREMIDADLLVDPSRFADAEQVIASLGFERFYPDFDLTERRRKTFMTLHHAFSYRRRSDAMQLDMHWRMLANPALMPNIEEVWSQAIVRENVGGRRLPMLSPGMHFVYVCVHGAKSGWARLKWLVDVDRAARGLSDDEAAEAADLFASDQLEPIVAVSMGLSRRVLGTPIPAAFAGLMQRDVSRLIDLEVEMISRDLPSRPHKMADWRHYLDRFQHSLSLKGSFAYRYHAAIRELARPIDLQVVPLPPGGIWMLAVLSPMIGAARALRRLLFANS